MRKSLRAAALVAAALSLVLGTPANAAVKRYQAEFATPVNPFCSLDEVMGPVGGYMLFPEQNCVATFSTSEVGVPVSVSFYMTGTSTMMCGSFTISGTLASGFSADGETPVTCANPGHQVTAQIVGNAYFASSFRLRWEPFWPQTPFWANAYVDYVEVSTIP